MSLKNWHEKEKKTSSNPKLKSSIVHKPFATGTVNIFNPYRNKSSDRESTPQTSVDTELQTSPQLSSPSLEEAVDPNWLNSLFNSWTIVAIAIVLLTNLISGAAIWRDRQMLDRVQESEPSSIPSSVDLSSAEFVPLELGTLSRIKSVEDSPKISLTPITPARAPLDHLAASASDPEYHYVLTEYTGERSLSESRQKVKQVALVNLPQGIFIYLGAFTAKEQAEEFVAQLAQEGFAAHVYPSH
jgi:hypothetical protein